MRTCTPEAVRMAPLGWGAGARGVGLGVGSLVGVADGDAPGSREGMGSREALGVGRPVELGVGARLLEGDAEADVLALGAVDALGCDCDHLCINHSTRLDLQGSISLL